MGIEIRALLITWLMAGALYFTYGQFVLQWITALPIMIALSLTSLPTPRWIAKRFSFLSLATVLLFLLIAGVSLLPPDGWGLRSVIVDVARVDLLPYMRGLFALAAVFVVVLYFSRSFIVFGIIVALMIGAFALVIPTSPRPQIDVWNVHDEGAQAFVNGENPYLHQYTNPYTPEVQKFLTPLGMMYPYLPGTFIWMSPWKAMGLDTRYSQLITHALTAILLLLITLKVRGRRDFASFAPSLLYLTFPMHTFFIVRAWNDDIAVMCYALAAWALTTRRPWALFIATNFLLLHKQYAIFFVPLLLWYAAREWKTWSVWIKGTIVAILINGAYAIADWRMFLGSLYGLFFLRFPNAPVFQERRDPFSLMNYMQLYTGHKTGLVFAIVVVAIAFIMWRRSSSSGALFRGFGAMALSLFAFALAAYANYYEFAWAMIVIGWAASRESERGWEFPASWSLVFYVATRAIILFCFSDLIIETRLFFPGAQGDTLLFNHTWFQLAMLACDIAIASFLWRKSLRVGLAVFVFGPLLIAPFYLTGPTLAVAVAIALIARLFPIRFTWIFFAGVLAALAIYTVDFAGFDVGFDSLLSPSHALIAMLALAPLLPPLRLRAPLAAALAFLIVALVGSFAFYFKIESIHTRPADFALMITVRNAFIALALISFTVAIVRKESRT